MSTNPILNYISNIVIYRNIPIIMQNYKTRCVYKNKSLVALNQVEEGINLDPVQGNFDYFKLSDILDNNDMIKDINNDYKDISPLYFYFVERNFGKGVDMREVKYARFYHIACLANSKTHFLIYDNESKQLRIAMEDYIVSKNITDYSLWCFLPFIPEKDRQGFTLQCVYIDPSVNTECNTELDLDNCHQSSSVTNVNCMTSTMSQEYSQKNDNNSNMFTNIYVITGIIFVVIVVMAIIITMNLSRKNMKKRKNV